MVSKGGIKMEDIFKTDIFTSIQREHSKKFQLCGTSLPTNQDIYFLAKWDEIFERYCTARLFLRKTFETDWNYWFSPIKNEDIQKAVEYKFKADMYETALINYNILVDLSWSITYVSAEYMLYKFDSDNNVTNAKEISGMTPIDEAYEMLRKTENGVSTPHAEGNPFNYLKVMAPEFSEVIDLIINFWKEFSQSDTRSLYNFIKHKGKPTYKEIESIRGGKALSIKIGNDEYPSDIRDVQRELVLEDEIQKLVNFDDLQLFPYIDKLLKSLNEVIQPSPFIF